MFGTDRDRRQYWREAEREPWYCDHPAREHGTPELIVPLQLHGDDVAVRKGLIGLTALVMSLSSPLASAFHDLLLIISLILKGVTSDALQIFYKTLAWSFGVLSTGKWPESDQNGSSWPHGTYRQKLAGSWLAAAHGSGYIAYVTDCLGDWKFVKEAWLLPQHFNKDACCVHCDASRNPHNENWIADVRPGAFDRRRRRTAADYLATFTTPPPLSTLPGWHLLMLLVDFMHTDHLGCTQWLIGNTLVILCESMPQCRGKWEVRMNFNLRILWREYRRWCLKHGHNKYRAWTVNRLAMQSGQDWPNFRSKAHEASLVCRFLCAFVRANRRPGDVMLLQCLHGHTHMNDIMDSAGTRFTLKQAKSFKLAGYVFLRAWVQLAVQNAGRNRFQIKPKHHLLEEGLNLAAMTLRTPPLALALWL